MSEFLINYMLSAGFSLSYVDGEIKTARGTVQCPNINAPYTYREFDTNIPIFLKGGVEYVAFEYGDSIYYEIAYDLLEFVESTVEVVKGTYTIFTDLTSLGEKPCSCEPSYCGYELTLRPEDNRLFVDFMFRLTFPCDEVIYYHWNADDGEYSEYIRYLDGDCFSLRTLGYILLGTCCENSLTLTKIKAILG